MWMWYRVEGECGEVTCDEFGVEHRNCNRMTFITTVSARSLSELCDTLANPSLNAPVATKISSIKRYSRPMYRDQIEPGQCNVLEDFEFCHIPECADYCVDNPGSSSTLFSNLIFSQEPADHVHEGELQEPDDVVLAMSDPSEPLVATAEAAAEVVVLGYEYFGDPSANEMEPDASLVNMCGCESIPQSLEISHSLGRSSEISRFLKSNSLSLPDSLRLGHRSSDSFWHSVVHLNSAKASRTIFFGLSCASNLWRFYLVAKQNDVQTKILLDMPPEIICPLGRMSFGIEMYFKKMPATVSTGSGRSVQVRTPKRSVPLGAESAADAYVNGIFVPNIVYYDGLDLFVDAFWERSPFKIKVNSTSTSPSTFMSLDGIV